MRAAVDLLVERGYDNTSMDEISARAGVSKATIYRYWPSKQRLAVDAVRELPHDPVSPETEDPRADAVAMLTEIARRLTQTPDGAVLPRLVNAAVDHPDLATAWREGVIATRRNHVASLVRRAQAVGQLRDDVDVDVVVDLLVAPLEWRYLVSGADPHRLPDELVHAVWTAYARAR